MASATFKVREHAGEDGFGLVTGTGRCVTFKYCGTALTDVLVAEGVRVAFVLVKKGSHWGIIGTVPAAGLSYRDFGDHEGAVAVYSDGGLSERGGEKEDRLPPFGEGDLIELKGGPDREVCMSVNGIAHHRWCANEGDAFAVSGANDTTWRLSAIASATLNGGPVGVQQPQPSAGPPPPSPEPDFLEACFKGNLAEVERRIGDGTDVRHETLVHAAAARGHVKVLNALLAAGADKEAARSPGSFGCGGDTPMHTAASRGQVKVVQALIDAGANKDARLAGSLQTPLHQAAHSGHVKVVQLLCEAGADKHAQEAPAPQGSGYTPMHMGLKHTSVVKALLNAGADDEVVSDRLLTPLELARRLRYKPTVKLLEKAAQARDEPPDGPAPKKQRRS
mmetsp:Transcript_23121/g.75379  ORF Transcript_23121/g.75379 Transcript_23121/m.75379 type:complete len:392 (+) Transcript_23121:61-1236(+)